MITALTENECLQFLAKNCVGHIAYLKNKQPYLVPITYFFNQKETLICYSSEGDKINALRAHKKTALCTSVIHDFNDWKSVQAVGDFEEIVGSDAKLCLREFTNGIKFILENTAGKSLHFVNEFSNKSKKNEIPVVFKVHIHQLTGKKETPS